MSGEHFDNVARTIASEMVAAGLPETVAPVPAALAASRIMGGEQSAPVIRELVERYQAHETTPKRAGLGGGNPWQTGQVSITRQVMIEHADPALAARMRREASR